MSGAGVHQMVPQVVASLVVGMAAQFQAVQQVVPKEDLMQGVSREL